MAHDPCGDTDGLLSEGYRIESVMQTHGRTSLLWRHGEHGRDHLVLADSFEKAIAKFARAASEHRMRIFRVVRGHA